MIPILKDKFAWKKWMSASILICSLCFTAACSEKGDNRDSTDAQEQADLPASPASDSTAVIDEQPGRVYYEIFVRSFYDSDGDGIGDLNGITEKLDYLNDGKPGGDDLGVEGIWLMPINPSPSYHGYDVTDYYEVNPEYGTMEDLQHLLEEAHKRGMKVIMDLVVNHTSTEHPWFVESASSLDNTHRAWYKWEEDLNIDPSGLSAAGSGPAWHEKNGNHYLGTFWSGMPDLNFDLEAVREEMKKIGKFWLEQGFDGFRLDAAKHIYEDLQSDRSPETTAKNVAWWQEFRAAMNEVKEDAYIVGEVWENSPVSIAPYLENAFDSGFNFGLADQIIRTVSSEQNGGFLIQWNRNYELFAEKSQGQFVDAIFLANHDQNRVMSQLSGNKDHARMAAAILLTLPGNPFIYYGEEIGMKGSKPDEEIREPMLWSKNSSGSKGQTTWEQAKHNQDDDAVNVEAQLTDPSSLLSLYRNVIEWRTGIAALRDGAVEDYSVEDDQVLSYIRATASEQVLVVHNLSSEAKEVSLSEKEPHFSAILHQTDDQASLQNGTISLPPYSTVVLK
ncbi:alpha-amylase family glycosyl hydrolase [Paenibacillus polygoni]|uniref:Alpha-amylase n=1 Tax=Paenibacillus polygoni TaxID=3050112 RepID=A0ABY8X296_9BACL|nr:alpha-amylase family glycosyl hydrolase [Paenibacillus polygoni]WIV19550.1 alpha-amylase family glycosyl hydrolase [Paenibacillus polygoni]